MLSSILGAGTLVGAAALTVCALNVMVTERLARADGRPLPHAAEWSAMCRRIHYRMLAPALISTLTALIASARFADDRWQVGAALMIGATCYAWFTIVPAGAVLHTVDPSRSGTLHMTKARFRAFALSHYPLAALGLSALTAFAWAVAPGR